jgi:CRP/FNR family nitrogen fixation transcriptional regulator
MRNSNSSLSTLPAVQPREAAAQSQSQKSLSSLAVLSNYHRGQEICGQGNPAHHWYCVFAGVARRTIVRRDGRRQIVDLLLPGDYFGFTTSELFDFGVEAVRNDTMIASYSCRAVELVAESNPVLEREIRQATFEALSRLQCQLLIVGRIAAVEKVSSFILEMASRLPHDHRNNIALPISRYDIADYLAVSVETVSRSLSDLKHRGVIKLSGTRTIEIMNQKALEDSETLARLSSRHGARYWVPSQFRSAGVRFGL